MSENTEKKKREIGNRGVTYIARKHTGTSDLHTLDT